MQNDMTLQVVCGNGTNGVIYNCPYVISLLALFQTASTKNDKTEGMTYIHYIT